MTQGVAFFNSIFDICYNLGLPSSRLSLVLKRAFTLDDNRIADIDDGGLDNFTAPLGLSRCQSDQPCSFLHYYDFHARYSRCASSNISGIIS